MGNDTLILANMSWPELERILPSVELAIIPTGSCEQHGPNMTFQTDAGISYALAERIAQRLYPRALLTPVVPFGFSFLHKNFPGMITLRHETLAGIIEDMVVSLKRMGIKAFLIVNAHGHNMPCLRVIMTKIRHEQQVKIATSYYISLASDVIKEGLESDRYGHACEMEVSMALYLAPRLVKHGQLTKGDLKPLPYPYSRGEISLAWPFTYDQLTANGALGNAPAASLEFGREITETTISRTLEFVEALLAEGSPEWD